MEACWCMGWAGLGGAACGCRQDREGVRVAWRWRLSRRELLNGGPWCRLIISTDRQTGVTHDF